MAQPPCTIIRHAWHTISTCMLARMHEFNRVPATKPHAMLQGCSESLHLYKTCNAGGSVLCTALNVEDAGEKGGQLLRLMAQVRAARERAAGGLQRTGAPAMRPPAGDLCKAPAGCRPPGQRCLLSLQLASGPLGAVVCPCTCVSPGPSMMHNAISHTPPRSMAW